MKKIFLFVAIMSAFLAMVSCDTKSCKCYVYNGNSTIKEIEYVSQDQSCSSLDFTRGNAYRFCTEYNEPDIDPDDIARPYKK
ncbi:MAG: hypothetical protein J6X58_07890 [Bacteroidales bacterium]|nr:hypothetical protein [Bacteroidales bacterium]